MSGSWCVFTELITSLGVQDLQVEELYALDLAEMARLKPIYGLIFLFKWVSDKEERKIDNNPNVFFANQVVNNACATQAILSILLNQPSLDIGPVLEEFKNFTRELPPDMKGLALTNSESIKQVHNSFGRQEPFVLSEKKATEDDDVFHFISYLPIDGRAIEIKLQAGPISHGECTVDNWLELVKPVLERRIERYASNEIRFNLLALVKNVKNKALEEIARLKVVKESLGNQPQSQDQLNAVDSEIAQLESVVEQETAKFAQWKTENIRRKHNYVPFLLNLLKILAEKGELTPLVEKAIEKQKATRR